MTIMKIYLKREHDLNEDSDVVMPKLIADTARDWAVIEPAVSALRGVKLVETSKFGLHRFFDVADDAARAALEQALPSHWRCSVDPFRNRPSGAMRIGQAHDFERAVMDFAEGEAKYGKDDPCEGEIVVPPGKPPQP